MRPGRRSCMQGISTICDTLAAVLRFDAAACAAVLRNGSWGAAAQRVRWAPSQLKYAAKCQLLVWFAACAVSPCMGAYTIVLAAGHLLSAGMWAQQDCLPTAGTCGPRRRWLHSGPGSERRCCAGWPHSWVAASEAAVAQQTIVQQPQHQQPQQQQQHQHQRQHQLQP